MSDPGGGPERAVWVPSEAFARYAQADLDRWRQVVGHAVEPKDPRWQTGRIESVSWGSCCEHVAAYVQVKIRYGAGWTAIAHSETWHVHHRSICVPEPVAAILRECLDADLSDEQRVECLERHTRDLRARYDADVLARTARLRDRVQDKARGTTSEEP